MSEQVSVGAVVQPQDGGVSASDDDLVSSVTYQLTGVFPARNFFTIHNDSAEIRVTRDLRDDAVRAPAYTLRVIAYDVLYPLNVATATVTINVDRNPAAPSFTEESSNHNPISSLLASCSPSVLL